MTVPLVQSASRRWLTIGCALTIVCSIMLPVAPFDLKSAGLPRQWRETRGIVDSATVGSTTSSSGRLGVDVAYVPDVRYRYTVDGREFRGDTVHRGLAANSEEEARATVERYPVGTRVRVFYDPEAPEQAVPGARDPPADLPCGACHGRRPTGRHRLSLSLSQAAPAGAWPRRGGA